MDKLNELKLKSLALELRKRVIEIGFNCGSEGAHFGGTLSLIEIMIALYKNVIPYDQDVGYSDKIIISKGHGVLAQYLLMENTGLLTKDEVDHFKEDFAVCAAHPSRDLEHYIDYSSGSLGQGLSLGFGIALARKRSNMFGRIFVILGDGECDEGSVWESVASAAHYQTENLVAIIDKNEIQYDGFTDSVLNLGNLNRKFTSFGWDAVDVDGHNIKEVTAVLNASHDKPLAIIAHTIKGKGISFMENKPEWHHKALTKNLYHQAKEELEMKVVK